MTINLTFTIPVRTYSMLNVRWHWRKRGRINKEQRESMYIHLLSHRPLPSLPAKVTLTRLAPKFLDVGDNLNSASKALRDEIAKFYGTDDGSDRYEWVYRQERAREYGVRVEIESKGAMP